MSSGLHVVGRDDLDSFGVDLGDLVARMLVLDHRVYPLASHGHLGTPRQWEAVFRKHPDTWRALIDRRGALVAYWQIATLRDAQFERARRGLLNPGEIADHDYSELREAGVHNLYFASVCIDPAHRTLPTQWALMESFFAVAEKLARHGSVFDEVAAVAHSEQGRQICMAFDLESQGRAPDHGECFAGRFRQILVRFAPPLRRRLPRLLQLYGVSERDALDLVGLPGRLRQGGYFSAGASNSS